MFQHPACKNLHVPLVKYLGGFSNAHYYREAFDMYVRGVLCTKSNGVILYLQYIKDPITLYVMGFNPVHAPHVCSYCKNFSIYKTKSKFSKRTHINTQELLNPYMYIFSEFCKLTQCIFGASDPKFNCSEMKKINEICWYFIQKNIGLELVHTRCIILPEGVTNV